MDAKKRILIVDDEPQIAKIFGVKLKLAGYDVTSTTSGAEAIELVRNQKFDIMLLDILMPGVTGLDVLVEVRTFSNIPTLIFTAMQDASEIARKIGANGSVHKPLNPDHLVEKIEAILKKEEKQPD